MERVSSPEIQEITKRVQSMLRSAQISDGHSKQLRLIYLILLRLQSYKFDNRDRKRGVEDFLARLTLLSSDEFIHWAGVVFCPKEEHARAALTFFKLSEKWSIELLELILGAELQPSLKRRTPAP